MIEMLQNPANWFIGASIVGVSCLALLYFFVIHEFRRNGYVEQEPKFDYELLEAELMMDQTILSRVHREEMAARMVR
jgi:hypothetical protein